MKIIAVCGSRREKGNTATIINKTLEPFIEDGHETEIIYPGKMNISGCNGCEGCAKTGRCVVKDDMQEIYPKILEADAFIAGSPTYFYNMSSDMKKFIDRCYCLCSFDKENRAVWISRLPQTGPRFAGLISICEQNSADDMGFTPAAMQAAYESLGYRIVFNQKVLHAFEAGKVLQFKDQMDAAYSNGKKLLKTLELNRQRTLFPSGSLN
ncbi:MAG: flavodoxin family protein [Spirochaetales bacterium]|uniref:Flavodoxin family protein n=1 Tax=Candidatus Thalassospirochaeta sargassi TaxID=3119039 RepID=A0AAJ1IF23_9SPIO|nr:flavodoxin family protein [Spirochaetales bacterium]